MPQASQAPPDPPAKPGAGGPRAPPWAARTGAGAGASSCTGGTTSSAAAPSRPGPRPSPWLAVPGVAMEAPGPGG
eukprot:2547707-Alexandrium_andersonii.AAC.1